MTPPPTDSTPDIDPLVALAEQIATDLLRIGAVELRPEKPFTWASGLRSPIYCDNRLTLAHPDVRTRIAAGYEELIGRGGYTPDLIAGVATAGIPQAALVADRRVLPMAYVRPKPKGHGRENQVEGRVEPGQRVVVVEDLISTGGSSVAAAEAVRAAGAEPLVVLATFSYGFTEATRRFADAGLAFATLTNFGTLLRAAERVGALASVDLGTLRDWHRDPAAWSENYSRNG